MPPPLLPALLLLIVLMDRRGKAGRGHKRQACCTFASMSLCPTFSMANETSG